MSTKKILLTTKNKTMKKEDLKSGMIIELRKDGVSDLGLIVQSDFGLIVQFNNEFMNLSSFKPDLTIGRDSDFDIVSVRKPELEYQITREDLHRAKVIWERKEEVEGALIGEALIKEAKKKGFKNGNFECLHSFTIKVDDDNDFFLDYSEDGTVELWNGRDGNANCVFLNGKWAKIIEVDDRVVGNWYKSNDYLVYYLGDDRCMAYDLYDGHSFKGSHELRQHINGEYKHIETKKAIKLLK